MRSYRQRHVRYTLVRTTTTTGSDRFVIFVFCVCAGAVLVVMDAPVTMQRRRSLEQWSASESVHRLVWWTGCFPQLGAMKGFFGAFASFLRSSGCPGVERQLYELSSAHTCECSRAPGVPESPGSYTQVTRHRDCAN